MATGLQVTSWEPLSEGPNGLRPLARRLMAPGTAREWRRPWALGGAVRGREPRQTRACSHLPTLARSVHGWRRRPPSGRPSHPAQRDSPLTQTDHGAGEPRDTGVCTVRHRTPSSERQGEEPPPRDVCRLCSRDPPHTGIMRPKLCFHPPPPSRGANKQQPLQHSFTCLKGSQAPGGRAPVCGMNEGARESLLRRRRRAGRRGGQQAVTG